MAVRRPKRVPPQSPEDPPTKEDFEALEAFCLEVEHEEIDFESWSTTHSSLDLSLNVVISAESSEIGTNCEIRWCKTITKTSKDGSKITRVKLRENLHLPGPIQDGQILVLEGLGDEKDESCGDLRVIIRVK